MLTQAAVSSSNCFLSWLTKTWIQWQSTLNKVKWSEIPWIGRNPVLYKDLSLYGLSHMMCSFTLFVP